MDHYFHVKGGKARGAQQTAEFRERFSPLRTRIVQLRNRGVNQRVTADLVGVSAAALNKYLKREGIK